MIKYDRGNGIPYIGALADQLKRTFKGPKEDAWFGYFVNGRVLDNPDDSYSDLIKTLYYYLYEMVTPYGTLLKDHLRYIQFSNIELDDGNDSRTDRKRIFDMAANPNVDSLDLSYNYLTPSDGLAQSINFLRHVPDAHTGVLTITLTNNSTDTTTEREWNEWAARLVQSMQGGRKIRLIVGSYSPTEHKSYDERYDVNSFGFKWDEIGEKRIRSAYSAQYALSRENLYAHLRGETAKIQYSDGYYDGLPVIDVLADALESVFKYAHSKDTAWFGYYLDGEQLSVPDGELRQYLPGLIATLHHYLYDVITPYKTQLVKHLRELQFCNLGIGDRFPGDEPLNRRIFDMASHDGVSLLDLSGNHFIPSNDLAMRIWDLWKVENANPGVLIINLRNNSTQKYTDAYWTAWANKLFESMQGGRKIRLVVGSSITGTGSVHKTYIEPYEQPGGPDYDPDAKRIRSRTRGPVSTTPSGNNSNVSTRDVILALREMRCSSSSK